MGFLWVWFERILELFNPQELMALVAGMFYSAFVD
jgi:hypothetical protein